MSRVLKASGFVALTVQMLWGLAQVGLRMPGGPSLPGATVGAHAHFGVLSILAVVTGYAVADVGLTGWMRSVAVWGFVAGQWLLPATIIVGELAFPPLMVTAFLWGALLAVSMALVAWGVISQEAAAAGRTGGVAPADD
ncbi:hypothetical protein [Candidatus Halobonum tyrrellensis]|uniref:DUF8059 domain-containing protein n=1 Tax=Candidatus Halobonum tyrrellensis G22 TaxID=1324957 RepID=V4IX42_9EURY|nr:hypothetical protein [Candidatus Halobonum tyrrellensis]ESP87747.1 hypothetical protein K933_12518 [Candidatus Halobonum tyrrellensis G22]